MTLSKITHFSQLGLV